MTINSLLNYSLGDNYLALALALALALVLEAFIVCAFPMFYSYFLDA